MRVLISTDNHLVRGQGVGLLWQAGLVTRGGCATRDSPSAPVSSCTSPAMTWVRIQAPHNHQEHVASSRPRTDIAPAPTSPALHARTRAPPPPPPTTQPIPHPPPATPQGVWEKDEVRRDDSFRAFEEVLQLAAKLEVDMVLLGGDLFHENKPSRATLVRAIGLVTQYCLSDAAIRIKVLSDQKSNFVSGWVRCVRGCWVLGTGGCARACVRVPAPAHVCVHALRAACSVPDARGWAAWKGWGHSMHGTECVCM